jgi:phospholipase/lecithinase/hemolysin
LNKWQANGQNPRQSVAEGLADFWGGSANDYSDLEGRWEDRVQNAIDDGRYEQNTSGKGEVWRERAREGARDS